MVNSNATSGFRLKPYIRDRVDVVNAALVDIFHEANPEEDADRIRAAMTYSLMAGGKRIRPVLCIAAAEAVDRTAGLNVLGDMDCNSKCLLTVACALEMLHTYSLIHDDLPAMDDDELRRGRPTCHIAYDEATAILAGDGLLTLVFQLLSAIDLDGDTDAATLLSIIHRISRAAGYRGMVGGQMRDVLAEDARLSPAELEEIHLLKTGALIEAAVYSGALLGGGNGREIEQLASYARCVGLAFQVTDDILNVVGDSERMGKAIGTDDDRDKNTYPSVMGLDRSKVFARDLVNDALKALHGFDSRSDPLRAIASYIIERGE